VICAPDVPAEFWKRARELGRLVSRVRPVRNRAPLRFVAAARPGATPVPPGSDALAVASHRGLAIWSLER
jgi:hypothetical protein